MPSLEANQLLRVAADACDSRKAEDIRILALDPSESSLTDYFLICSGTNERQNVAISDEIEHRLKQEFGVYPTSVEGRRQGEWVLMDYVDFVVHIFLPEKRAYYGLEQLRKSAKSVSLDDLNSEIKAALTVTKAKRPTAKAAAQKDLDEETGGSSGSVSGKKPKPKEPAAKATKTAAPAKTAKATTPKKAAAKKTAAKKTAATTSTAKKVVAKKSVLTKESAGPKKVGTAKKA